MESKISLQQHHEARIAAVSRTPPFKNVHCCKYCSQLRIIIDKYWAPPPGTSKRPKAFIIENLTKELFQSAVASECPFFGNARSNEHHLLKSPFRLEVSSQRDDKVSVKLAPGIFRRSEGPAWLSNNRLERSSALTSGALLEVKKLMRKCGQTIGHGRCPAISKEFVPTRLIEIPKDDSATSLRVITTKPGEYVQWCSLSYCWGGPQLLCSTTYNFEGQERVLEIGDLGATIQDAVLVAKILEVPYLWIDSICIVQDDPRDIERELAHMPLIYKNSVITICASTTASWRDGFLHPWQTGGRRFKTPFRLHYTLVDQAHRSKNKPPTEGTAILYGGTADNYNYPLFTRAWALQEYILSPRVLMFGANNLRWECTETVPRLFPPGTPGPGLDEENISKCRIQLTANKVREMHNFTKIWYDIVEHYSERHISFADDKLVALAGLAEEVANRAGWEYAAGLWKDNIQRMACWHRFASEHGRRPSKYRAPSWSWASVDYASSLWNHLDILATGIVEVSAEPEVESLPFGKVRSGYMKLHCSSRKAILHQGQDGECSTICLDLKDDGHGGKAVTFLGRSDNDFVSDDSDSDSGSDRHMTFEICLDAPVDDFVGWGGNIGWDVHLFLVSEAKKFKEIAMIAKEIPDSDGAYQRVGLCTRRKRSKLFKEAFRGVTPRTVTIL
ncbi:HET-domain-containing protein [Amniculicola lignicola CBS 123094]|uniref:HET-domain-containing protein n=1 Tax=Amniculicola lignicola CBS 123094 TaxID=1392246 RepID=A0A6A5WVT8_9PLEO|nr:HET-domain-containing protein [Amniculicola lignicola CBS 123094]